MNRSQDEIARLAQYITETSAHDARGEWTPDDQVNHATNIYGRKYKTESGREGVFLGGGLEREKIAQWFFTDDDQRSSAPAYYADLRDGGLMPPEPRRTLGDWCVIAFVIAVLLGVIAWGISAMPAMPAPATGPGFEAACRNGC